jgi:hypothetical protein
VCILASVFRFLARRSCDIWSLIFDEGGAVTRTRNVARLKDRDGEIGERT